MTFDEGLTRVKDIAAVLSSTGAVVAAIWAITVHFRNQRDAAVSSFRRDLVLAIQNFNEMAAAFQNQIVAILERLFDRKNEEMSRVLEIVEQALAKPTKGEALDLMKAESHLVSETILYSLPAELHGLTYGVRLKYESTIAPLASFSPVVHLFFARAGRVVLAPYEYELSVVRIDEYAIQAVEVLWDTREAGKITLSSAADIRLHYRAIIARIMAAYDDDTTLLDIINAAHNLVREFAREYECPSLAAQWRLHRRDAKLPVAPLKAPTSTGTLKNIIEAKLKGRRDRQRELLSMVADLEKLLERK